MPDDLGSRYQQSLDRRLAGFKQIGDQQREDKLLRGKTREEKERIKREQAAQARRDERLNNYDVRSTNQRATIAADAAYNQQLYTLQRDKLQTLDQSKRDAAQQGYSMQRDKQQSLDQLKRDAAQQGYSLQRDDRQFGQQLQRDAAQQDYGVQNDERNFGQQLQRDAFQQDYGVQNDERTFGYQKQRDERLQGYDVQSTTQRQTFDLSSKLQDQINQARSNGMDFSADQKKERQSLLRAFQKHVMNNPNLDEGVRQKAALELQQKLLGIIPDEPVQTRQEMLKQSLLFDERVPGVPFMTQRDSQGNTVFEALGSNGSGGNSAKEALRKEELGFTRETDLEKLRDAVIVETKDPLTGKLQPEYMDGDKLSQTKVDAEIAKRFSAKDILYQQAGLPPHEIILHHAQLDREARQTSGYNQWYDEYQKNPDPQTEIMRQEHRKRKAEGLSPFATEQQAPAAQKPQATRKPTTVSSKNIDDQLKKSLESGGDRETAAALQTIKDINKKFDGPPPQSSPEFDTLMRALLLLEEKGVSTEQPKAGAPAAFQRRDIMDYGYPGM